MICVPSRLGEYVHLCALVAKFGWIGSCLDFEFLNRIDRGKHDIGIEIGIGIVDTVQGVIVEHDPLATGRDRLSGALSALPRCRLTSSGRKRVYVRRECDQVQILTAVQRQFGNDFVLQDGTNSGVILLQEVRCGGDLYTFSNLAQLQRDI